MPCRVFWADPPEFGELTGSVRILERHGVEIATALSYLESPGGQPIVMYCGGPGRWSAYVSVVLWEMLGVLRASVRARFAVPAKEWPVGQDLDGPANPTGCPRCSARRCLNLSDGLDRLPYRSDSGGVA